MEIVGASGRHIRATDSSSTALPRHNRSSQKNRKKFKNLVEKKLKLSKIPLFIWNHRSPPLKIGDVLLIDSNGTDIMHRLVNENLVPRARVEVSKDTFSSSNFSPTPNKSAASASPLPAPISSSTQAAAAVSAPTSVQKQGNSIVELLQPDKKFIFTVEALVKSGGFAGTLVREKEDYKVFDFDASTVEMTTNFRPTVGSTVVAFSPEVQKWFRAFIFKVLDSSFSVIYTDNGKIENVVSVKPIPSSFQHVDLGVKLTLVGDVSETVEKYFDNELYLTSSHKLQVISKEMDAVIAKLSKENAPPYAVRLEPWTSLLSQPHLSPLPLRDIPSLQWEPGFSCDVMLNFAENVDCIYVQIATEGCIKLASDIQQNLKDQFLAGPNFTTLPPVGSCVAALFPDYEGVYRARITKVNGEWITLFYSDFGNTSTVSIADVRPLPGELYEYHAISTRVALANVPTGPITIAVKNLLSEWADEIIKMVVLPSSSGLTECVLSKDGAVLNQLICNLLEQSLKNCVLQEMPQLEAAPPANVPLIVPGDNTLGVYSYGECKFEEIPEEGDVHALMLDTSSGPQLIMMRIASELLSVKLGTLEVRFTRIKLFVIFV